MNYINVYRFSQWFLEEIYYIFREMINYLDEIIIAPNVSLLDFTLTIAILGVLIPILITIPNKAKIGKEKRKNDK